MMITPEEFARGFAQAMKVTQAEVKLPNETKLTGIVPFRHWGGYPNIIFDVLPWHGESCLFLMTPPGYDGPYMLWTWIDMLRKDFHTANESRTACALLHNGDKKLRYWLNFRREFEKGWFRLEREIIRTRTIRETCFEAYTKDFGGLYAAMMNEGG